VTRYGENMRQCNATRGIWKF